MLHTGERSAVGVNGADLLGPTFCNLAGATQAKPYPLGWGHLPTPQSQTVRLQRAKRGGPMIEVYHGQRVNTSPVVHSSPISMVKVEHVRRLWPVA